MARDDRLIADIYRAAAGLHPWATALDAIVAACDAFCAHVIGIHKPSGYLAISLHSQRTPADAVLDYVREWHALDPHASEVLALPPTQIWSNRHYDHRFIVEHPFYRDYWLPAGLRHIMATKVLEDDHLVVAIGLFRGPAEAAFAAPEERGFARLATHLANALDIQRRTMAQVAQSAVGQQLLDRSSRPSLLVGIGGRIQYANRLARSLLNVGTLIVDRSSQLGARHPESDARLKAALNTLAAASRNPDVPNRCALGLRDIETGCMLPACLWAIWPQTTLGAFGADATGLIMIAASSVRGRPDPLVLTAMFGFTPGDTAVRLSEGSNL